MIIDILTKVIQNVFIQNEINEEIVIVKSNRPDLCDYQCDSLFKLGKLYKKNPIVLGDEIVLKINELDNFNDYFKTVTFANPGFINIVISDNLINRLLNDMINDDEFNFIKVNNPQNYFLDYGGPNIAKPLHVGHLRPAIIGESIKRIVKFMGHNTVSDVHLGDYGLQIGQVIYGVLLDNKPSITLEYLEVLYPKMSKLCKEDKDVLEKCASITKGLQDGSLEYLDLWKQICLVSGNDIKRIYKYLDVSFDLWQGESDSYKYIDKLTKAYENVIKDSEGAKIIEVKEESDTKEIPPLIYQKSNGAYLYGTTDLASIYERVIKYNASHILYVVDARQALHFEQVFRSAKKLNCLNGVDYKHLGLGTVNGLDGKPFKTRNGDVAKLDDLFKDVKNVFINIKENNKYMNEQDLDIIVNAIIKFADLQNSRKLDYIFDINKFSQINGKTGPYILYTYLRINKILKEENLNCKLLSNIYNEYDRNVRLKLIEYPLSLSLSFKELMPNYIAEYVYDLSVIMNNFYQNNHIKDNEEIRKQEWLLLLNFSNVIIKKMLELLIIDIPSEM